MNESEQIKSLSSKLSDGDVEVRRASKRALLKIVRHAGRPGAVKERASVIRELLLALNSTSSTVIRREVMWVLSEIGGDESVDSIVALLKDKDSREDARMILDRIPGEKSLEALKSALKTVPDDFRINIVQSLRHRGVEVPGFPCQKLVPTKQTKVKPVQ